MFKQFFLIFVLAVVVFGTGGCATPKYTMKNCTPKDKPFWDCEKP